MRILYDGWPLVYAPSSPAALHLLALLAYRPAQVEALVAIPGEVPFALPNDPARLLEPAPDRAPAHLRWEQADLSRLAQRSGVQLIHRAGGSPALFGPRINVISPAGYGPPPLYTEEAGHSGSLSERLRESLAQGGMSRLRGLLWPADLPSPAQNLLLVSLPPVVYLPEPDLDSPGKNGSAGKDAPEEELPETYILYHGPQRSPDLRRMLEAWSWAAGTIGEYHPLLVAGLDDSACQALPALAREYNLAETVRALPSLHPSALVDVYRHSSALFHPAPVSPWGGSVRMALSAGVPVVAFEDPLADAIAGPAAYLVRRGPAAETNRALGAALLTIIVEESVAEGLALAARQRAQPWLQPEHIRAFKEQLLAAYEKFLA